MFIFEFDLSNKIILPNINNWLSPNYTGPGDLLINPNQNNPNNWKTDFPDYDYKYEELQELKTKLNITKHKLDKYYSNPDTAAKFNKIITITRPQEILRGESGVLVQAYNAEIVTNAWMKMFECMKFMDPILEKINKCKDPKFNSIHFAEAPGNFILAINHYIKTNYHKINWDWLANSYRDLYSRVDNEEFNTHYLTDHYGLIKKYKDNWIFGADGDGDISSPANIRSFKQETIQRFNGKVHLATSDVKYVPVEVNYDEEEMINKPVHLGHLLSSLITLQQGGVMILKEFTFFEAPSVSLLFLAAYCFKKLLVVKPMTSRAANSEVYIIGIDYKKNLSEIQMDKLLNIMEYIRYLNTASGSPAIFTKNDIPDTFVTQVAKLSKQLVEMQIPAIDFNIENYEKYKNTPINKINADFTGVQQKIIKIWVAKNKIKKLNDLDKIGSISNLAKTFD